MPEIVNVMALPSQWGWQLSLNSFLCFLNHVPNRSRTMWTSSKMSLPKLPRPQSGYDQCFSLARPAPLPGLTVLKLSFPTFYFYIFLSASNHYFLLTLSVL